jgi:hypothetical protein
LTRVPFFTPLVEILVYLPALYLPVAALLAGLLIETWFKRKMPWSLPAAMLYLTIGAWYLADLFISPENYDKLHEEVLNLSYAQVALFLLSYRMLVPIFAAKLTINAVTAMRHNSFRNAELLFAGTVILWLGLLSYGVRRLDGELIAALFPLDARAGVKMWQRSAGADAEETGFLVSAASYLYILACASFGIWVFFLRSVVTRCLSMAFMAISWPYFLLSGTRNIFLAVSLPFFIAYLLFGRQPLWFRCLCLLAAFLVVDTAFRAVVSYRNVGFRGFLERDERQQMIETTSRHQGLNMIEELCFVNDFTQITGPAYGARYLQELLNLVPRAIWPSKPLLGVDYAGWRGFEGGSSDIGVTATISSGLIGGGVLNFGRLFGPVASAVLMSIWSALLARWWLQRESLLRCFLFLTGLGLTFNLGRDITLLVLWPIVFGYLIARGIEIITYRKSSDLRSDRGPYVDPKIPARSA